MDEAEVVVGMAFVSNYRPTLHAPVADQTGGTVQILLNTD